MLLETFEAIDFPYTSRALGECLEGVSLDGQRASVAIFGGCARSALLELTLGIKRPIRDIDLVAFGNACTNVRFAELHKTLNPTDEAAVKATRYPDIPTLFATGLDFTINQAVIELGIAPRLTASTLAVNACVSRLLIPTQGRIDETKKLAADGALTEKQFLRNRTNMPARTAYFVAVFRAAGIDFNFDLLDHPRPVSPEQAHSFFLGLMVRKSLMVDEAERGPGDTSATRLLIDLYREMNMIGSATPKTVEGVVAFCEAVNAQHPHLKFYGSDVAGLVKHVAPATAVAAVAT